MFDTIKRFPITVIFIALAAVYVTLAVVRTGPVFNTAVSAAPELEMLKKFADKPSRNCSYEMEYTYPEGIPKSRNKYYCLDPETFRIEELDGAGNITCVTVISPEGSQMFDRKENKFFPIAEDGNNKIMTLSGHINFQCSKAVKIIEEKNAEERKYSIFDRAGNIYIHYLDNKNGCFIRSESYSKNNVKISMTKYSGWKFERIDPDMFKKRSF